MSATDVLDSFSSEIQVATVFLERSCTRPLSVLHTGYRTGPSAAWRYAALLSANDAATGAYADS